MDPAHAALIHHAIMAHLASRGMLHPGLGGLGAPPALSGAPPQMGLGMGLGQIHPHVGMFAQQPHAAYSMR